MYLLLTNKIKVKISSFFKILIIPWCGLVFANPILLIPPLNIGSCQISIKFTITGSTHNRYTGKKKDLILNT